MRLSLNSDLFEYDIRGLLSAFYPWEKFETDGESDDGRLLSVLYCTPEGESDPKEVKTDLKTKIRFEADGSVCEEEILLPMHEKKRAKTYLKQTLYRIFSAHLEKTLPWGTLTGIRPTKIAMDGLFRGEEEAEILRHMEGDLYCSAEKAELALSIAKREKPILDIAADNGYSLYIGIPFCPSICLYCSFASSAYEAYRAKVPAYLETLFKELSYVAKRFENRPLHTVYFGGGTPTSLTAEDLDLLLTKVETLFDLSALKEFTVEAGRPDSITEEKLAVLKKHPVTRISVNPQTMQQKTLDLIGRRHTVEEVREKYLLARKMGFDNINMDLILGLPGETEEDVKATLSEILGLNPDSVTIHSLAIKRSSALNLHKEIYSAYRMENTDGLMRYAREQLARIGVAPYYLYRQKNMAGNQENVGYARPGKEGIYNVLIMEEAETIVACGAGATSKRVDRETGLITRAANVHDVDTYLRNIDEMLLRKEKLYEGF